MRDLADRPAVRAGANEGAQVGDSLCQTVHGSAGKPARIPYFLPWFVSLRNEATHLCFARRVERLTLVPVLFRARKIWATLKSPA